jgi:hypothetical protein
MNISVEHYDSHSDKVYISPIATVPFRDTDTRATKEETSMTLNMDTMPFIADETTDGPLGIHADDKR